IYRFPPPKDPTGHDLYRLALRRVENWEKRCPGRLRDVTGFARAEALEHLGEYRTAADLYRQVAALPSPLAEHARQGAERAGAFAEAAALPEDAPDVDGALVALRAKLDAWGKVVARQGGTPWEPAALAEEERLEGVAARLVVAHRRAVEDGTTAAERALRFVIQKHAESKELPGHILHLADFYAELARDYVTEHPRPLAFDEDEFVRRTDRALATYRKVATWDGAREKPEAEGPGIDERVRLIAAHRPGANGELLAPDVADLEARDQARRDAGLPPTGLADDARYLAAGLVPTRDAQREALHAVLEAHPDPLVRRLAEHELEVDEAATADRLLADDRHNRRAAVLNDAVRPLGIFSGGALLAALNPFLLAGSAADSVITTAVNLWHYDRLSAPKREALARYRSLLEREPQTRDAPEIARAIP